MLGLAGATLVHGMNGRRFAASRASLFAIALALVLIDCAAAWCAFHPAVGTEYDLYYLKRKLRTWPGKDGLGYQPGERMNFSKPLPYLSRTGWSDPEPWGTWTDGDRASLFLVLPAMPSGDMTLRVEGHGFVDALHPEQSVRVVVNGTDIGALEYTSQDTLTQTLPVPGRVFPNQNVEIDLIPGHPASPSHADASKDTRRLGLAVASIELAASQAPHIARWSPPEPPAHP